MMFLLFSLLLDALSDFGLFRVASLAAQFVRILAWYLNQPIFLEVVKELDNIRVNMVLRLWEHSLLSIIGLVLLLLYLRHFCLSFGIGFCRSSFSALNRLAFDECRFFNIFLLYSLALFIYQLRLFRSQCLTSGLFLLGQELCSAFGSFFSSARLSSLPACLKCLLSVLFVRVFNQRNGFRSVPFHEPGDVLGLAIQSLALRPLLKVEGSLDHIVVLNFFSIMRRAIGKPCVRAEQEMTEVHLVVTPLDEDGLAIIEDFKRVIL